MVKESREEKVGGRAVETQEEITDRDRLMSHREQEAAFEDFVAH